MKITMKIFLAFFIDGLGLVLGLGLGVKGRACVSEIELDGHVQCTLGFKENNFQTQRAAPT